MFNSPSYFRNLFYISLIVIVGLFIYSNTLHNPFIFDDEYFVVHNVYFHNLADLKSIGHFYKFRYLGNLSFALNYAIGGAKVEGYHLVNILLHISCALLVGWLTSLILTTHRFSKLTFNIKKEQFAFWVAFLFLVHPVQSTAINQVTQRYVPLVAIFYLSSIALYIKARFAFDRSRWIFLIGALFTGLMAAFSRQTAITLPVMILICESMFFNDWKDWSKGLGNRYLIFFLFLCAVVVILFFYNFDINKVIFEARYLSQSHVGEVITWFNYFLTQFRVFMIYVRLLLFPKDLNFDYDVLLSQSFCDIGVVIGFSFVALMMIYSWLVKEKLPLISFGIWWFFVSISIESTIIPISYVITEYRLYLPLFGFSLSMIWFLQSLIKNPNSFTGAMTVIVLVLSVLTFQRNEVYRSTLSLWLDTAQKSPMKARVYTNLGSAYIQNKQYKKAIETEIKAIELGAQDYKTYHNLASAYDLVGMQDKAIETYYQEISKMPNPMAYNNLGIIYLKKKDLKKAKESFIKANTLTNPFQEVSLNLARIYWDEGDIKQAIKWYNKTLSKYPFENRARYALAQIYLQLKDFPKAKKQLQGVRLDSQDDLKAIVQTGVAFANKGFADIALGLFNKALHIDKNYAPAQKEVLRIKLKINSQK